MKEGELILEELDLEILTDLIDGPGSTEDKPIWVPCYYIGWPWDDSAGLIGGSIGPSFPTIQEALDWVVEQGKNKLEVELASNY